MILRAYLILILMLAFEPTFAACVDGFNPKNGKTCGGSGSGEPETATCNEIFNLVPGACWELGAPGTDCVFERFGDNTPGWVATMDCQTSTTLTLPVDNPILSGNGHQMALVGPWTGGTTGFTNSQGKGRIVDFLISTSNSLIANGCSGPLLSAVRLDPDLPDAGVPRLTAAGLTISTSGGASFCNAIEYVGSTGAIRVPQFMGGVGDNNIDVGAFELAGIWVNNINATDNVSGKDADKIVVRANRIGIDNPDGDPEAYCSTGIIVGPDVERAIVQDNEIVAPLSAPPGHLRPICTAIEIRASGSNSAAANCSDGSTDFCEARPIELDGNIITTSGDGGLGVYFAAGTTAETQNNQLFAPTDSDGGFCIHPDADVSLATRKNRLDEFNGFHPDSEVFVSLSCE